MSIAGHILSKMSYAEVERAYHADRITDEEMRAFVKLWRHSAPRFSSVGTGYHVCDECSDK